MPFIRTTATEKIIALKNRERFIQGGTSAGKTIGILQDLIDQCQSYKSADITSVVSESLPHLKKAAMRDFKNIMIEQKYFKDTRFNKSDNIYTFETGQQMEFFSADQPMKVRGPRRKRLFVNECNGIPFETYEQLEVRTEDAIYADWNPSAEFWFEENILNNPAKTGSFDHIVLTYKDNEALPESIVKSIESRQNRLNWWRVFGMGLVGSLEGKIYENWHIWDDIPFGARLERYIIDFGYTTDPTFVGALYYFNGGYIVDELAYQTEMSNKDIADLIKNQPKKALVIADSAEPKSIAEIQSYSITIVGATKGKDSVNYGIQRVQEQTMGVTKNSVNVIKENRNYCWAKDKITGRNLNVPEDEWNHAMDGIRYGICSLAPVKAREEMVATFPRREKTKVQNEAR